MQAFDQLLQPPPPHRLLLVPSPAAASQDIKFTILFNQLHLNRIANLCPGPRQEFLLQLGWSKRLISWTRSGATSPTPWALRPMSGGVSSAEAAPRAGCDKLAMHDDRPLPFELPAGRSAADVSIPGGAEASPPVLK